MLLLLTYKKLVSKYLKNIQSYSLMGLSSDFTFMHIYKISKKYSEFLEKPILPLIDMTFFIVKTTFSKRPRDQISDLALILLLCVSLKDINISGLLKVKLTDYLFTSLLYSNYLSSTCKFSSIITFSGQRYL